MPIVAISAARLNQLLGQEFDMETLVHGIRQLGCDVEDTAILALYKCPACGTPNDKLEREDPPKRCDFCGYESEAPFEQFATDKVIRLDLLAVRPDLFDPGGLSRALKGYLGLESGLPEFSTGVSGLQVQVDPIMSKEGTYRPHIVCAVVEAPALDHTSLREIMRLQEHLHWGIGRDRKLASIGVYDLDTIEGPIRYSVVDPDDFTFCPLGMPGVQMTPNEILQRHPKGVGYKHLMDMYAKYPILTDANGLVLSMPPIINSDVTKCKLGTRRLFVDVTGLSAAAVVDSLVTLVCALVELGGEVKTVRMNYPDGAQDTPDLTPGTIDISYDDAKKWLGLPFNRDEFLHYLRKMRLNVTPKGDLYEVTYPAFRTDIRHEVDVFEDLAIGFGYENIEPAVVPTLTIGEARPEEKMSALIRQAMIGLGFTEIMTLLLQSVERHFTKLNLQPDSTHVIVENPKTVEQKVVRNHMLTGILETFNKNRRKTVPQKIFEIGNVVHINAQKETGTDEYRHLAFAVIGPDAGYAEGRMTLDAILHELGWRGDYAAALHPSFTEGRRAEITNENGLWALLGEIHPQVLNNFGLAHPVLYGEVRLMKVI